MKKSRNLALLLLCVSCFATWNTGTAYAVEYAQPGITINNNVYSDETGELIGSNGSYTTVGDEYVKWITDIRADDGYGHPMNNRWEFIYSPSGIKAVIFFRNGVRITANDSFSRGTRWGIRRYQPESTRPDRCDTTGAEGELWKVRNYGSQLSCADAKRVMDYYLENEHSVVGFRCRMPSDTTANCWRKGYRLTQFASAVETDATEINNQWRHRREEIVYCGQDQGGSYIYTRAGKESSCDAFSWAAGRIAASSRIYGITPLQTGGWNCSQRTIGLLCYSGDMCAAVVPNNRNLATHKDADASGSFWWSETGSPC